MAKTPPPKPRSNQEANAKAPPRSWLTRLQIADLCRVSPQTIDYWQRQGHIHPVLARAPRSPRPAWYFDPDEVAKRSRHRDVEAKTTELLSDLAARAFELFDQSMKLRDVVCELRCDPRMVEDLYQQWLDLDGATLAIGTNDRKQLEAIVGSVGSGGELVARVRELAKRVATHAAEHAADTTSEPPSPDHGKDVAA
jgi:hypothetical protein